MTFAGLNGPVFTGVPTSCIRLDVTADPLLPAVSCLSDGENFPTGVSHVKVIRFDESQFDLPISSDGSITIMVADLYNAPTALTVQTDLSGITLEFPSP